MVKADGALITSSKTKVIVSIEGEDKISFKRAPHIGENTSEILSEMGIDEETQKTLIKKGVIA